MEKKNIIRIKEQNPNQKKMMKRKWKFLRLININLIKVQMDIFIVGLAEEDMSQVIYVKDLVYKECALFKYTE